MADGVDVETWAGHAIWWSERQDFLDWCSANHIGFVTDPWAIWSKYKIEQRALAAQRERDKVRSLPRRRWRR